MRSLGFGLSSSLCSPDFTGVSEAWGAREEETVTMVMGQPSLSSPPSLKSDSHTVTDTSFPQNWLPFVPMAQDTASTSPGLTEPPRPHPQSRLHVASTQPCHRHTSFTK